MAEQKKGKPKKAKKRPPKHKYTPQEFNELVDELVNISGWKRGQVRQAIGVKPNNRDREQVANNIKEWLVSLGEI